MTLFALPASSSWAAGSSPAAARNGPPSSGAPLPGVYVDAESLFAVGELSSLSMEAAAQAQTEDDGSFSLPPELA